MKVVFLFMSKGSAEPGSTKTNDWIFKDAGNYYQDEFGDECYFKMLETLVAEGTIKDLKVFFESGVNPGKTNFVKGADNYVIPEIRLMEPFIDYDTVIFVRGGFKHWHDFLYKYKGHNWLMIYGANTGRQKWKWWDVNLDDTHMSNEIDVYGRYQFPFIKPTNEDVFHPIEGANDFEYDVCLGASHIHDKKGQYHGFNLIKKYKEIFGHYPKCVMPGALRRSKHTIDMISDPIFSDEIEAPGRLTKPELNALYSKCKLFLHLGSVGQNDRGAIEAYASGLPIGLRTLAIHNPLLTPDERTIFHFDIDSDPEYEKSARKLKLILDYWKPEIKKTVFADYSEKMGYLNIAIPSLRILFNTIGFEGKPTINAKEHLKRRMETFKGEFLDGKY